MKTLSPTRIFRVLRHAPYLCVLPLPKSLLPASSALVIVILSCGSQPLGTGCRELLSVAQSRHTSTPPFPQLNFHKARVHRNRQRPRANGFTGRAQNSPPAFTPQGQRASDKALTLTKH